MDAYPKDVRFVFKHFPLPMHPNARPAAEAAEFARQHGKFWELHDLLFQNFGNLTMDTLRNLGKQVGLDEKALEASVTSQANKTKIEKDVEGCRKATVQGTPTIFVNGKRLQQRTFEGFKAAIDDAKKAKSASVASN